MKINKQHIVSLSSVEAEYWSLGRITTELAWLARLLHDLDILDILILIKCDSQAIIYIAKNQVFHERIKYIDLDCHFVKD